MNILNLGKFTLGWLRIFARLIDPPKPIKLPCRCTVAVSCSNFSFFTPNCGINQLPHISSTSVKSHSFHSHQITVDKLSATQVIIYPLHPKRIPIALDGFPDIWSTENRALFNIIDMPNVSQCVNRPSPKLSCQSLTLQLFYQHRMVPCHWYRHPCKHAAASKSQKNFRTNFPNKYQ